jgi:hypothetical protein
VAYIETVLIENEDKINHVPYAAGLMRVIPGEMLPPKLKIQSSIGIVRILSPRIALLQGVRQ